MASKRKKNKKQAESKEFYENPDVLAERIGKTEEFFEKNKTLSLSIFIGLGLVIISFFVYRYYMDNQNKLAQDDMFQAVFYFEQDSLDLALNGDGNNYGFKDIVTEYSGTESANLANFYSGVIHLKKGNSKVAILYLEDFSTSDLLVQSRAYSLIGDANMELGEFDEAVEYYNKAANHRANEYFSPIYLRKAAVAYEKLEQWEGAIDCYQKIMDDDKSSTEVETAKKNLARLNAKTAS